MTSFLIFLLVVEVLYIFKWGYMYRDRVIEFPMLAALVFLGWVVPQMLGLAKGGSGLPPGALDKASLMAILSLFACFWGYRSNSISAAILNWEFDRGSLLISSIILLSLGTLFIYLTRGLASEVSLEYGGQWTGIITIYVFFSGMFVIGFALAFNLLLQKQSWFIWILVSYGFLVYFEKIIIYGRRAAMIELFSIVFISIYYNRRWAPPKITIIALGIVGVLVINGIGMYRVAMLEKDRTTWTGAGIEQVVELNFTDNLESIVAGEKGNYEVFNAAINIEATSRTLDFDYGLSLWNSLVFNFVPAQLIGSGLKNSLMFDLRDSAFIEFGHQKHTGTTSTGLSDAFISFWYLGALIFYFIGYIMNRWHRAALDGSFSAQLVVVLTMSAALHTITHTTHHFFIEYIKLLVFLLPFLVFSRIGAIKTSKFYLPDNSM